MQHLPDYLSICRMSFSWHISLFMYVNIAHAEDLRWQTYSPERHTL